MTRPGDLGANLIGPETSILDAVAQMDAARRKLLLVVDDERRLLGAVTDGDIRRGLMRRLPMEAPVREVMNPDPVALTVGSSDLTALARLEERGVSLAPVVRARGQPCPKPMLKVACRPLLETIIERLQAQGFGRFRLAVNYLAEVIEDHFGDGAAMGAEIRYLREDHPRGTAGALSLLDEPVQAPMLVMNGDVLTRVNFSDLIDFHSDLKAEATLCVREPSFQSPHGVAETDGPRLLTLREKPTFRWLANAGIYCLDPGVLGRIPREGPYDMPELLAGLAAEGRTVGAFPIHEYWLDIGRPPDFETAQTDFQALFD